MSQLIDTPFVTADASAVTNVLEREIIPPLGIPYEIHSDKVVNNANNQLFNIFRYQS